MSEIKNKDVENGEVKDVSAGKSDVKMFIYECETCGMIFEPGQGQLHKELNPTHKVTFHHVFI